MWEWYPFFACFFWHMVWQDLTGGGKEGSVSQDTDLNYLVYFAWHNVNETIRWSLFRAQKKRYLELVLRIDVWVTSWPSEFLSLPHDFINNNKCINPIYCQTNNIFNMKAGYVYIYDCLYMCACELDCKKRIRFLCAYTVSENSVHGFTCQRIFKMLILFCHHNNQGLVFAYES